MPFQLHGHYVIRRVLYDLLRMKAKCDVGCRDEGHAHLPPLEPLNVEIGESESLLAAGTVSSILEGTIVVQVPCLTHS